MTISITIAAAHIPDGHTVFKPGGTKPYELTRGLTLYIKGQSGHQQITPAPDTVYLLSHAPGVDVSQVPMSTMLRLDFEGADAAIEFLEEAKGEEGD